MRHGSLREGVLPISQYPQTQRKTSEEVRQGHPSVRLEKRRQNASEKLPDICRVQPSPYSRSAESISCLGNAIRIG